MKNCGGGEELKMVAKEFECPSCYGDYHSQSLVHKSMICNSPCPCKTKCMELSKAKRGGNTNLLSGAGQTLAPATSNNAENEWRQMFDEIISILNQDPNLVPIATWISEYRRQKLGR